MDHLHSTAKQSTSDIDKSLNIYFKQIHKFPLLVHEEEIALGHIIQQSRCAKAIEQLIVSNLRLVIAIAKKFQRRGLSLSELIAEGNTGLIKAVIKFDPDRGNRFSTYASWWIRQAITQALSEQVPTIHIPVHQREKINKYKKQKRAQEQKIGRELTNKEIDKLPIIQGCPSLREVLALDSLHNLELTPEKDIDLKHTLGLISIPQTPEQSLYKNAKKAVINKVLDTLTKREREVIILRFGLNGNQPHTLQEVGELFSITRERVRQIEKKAIKKLKHPMRKERLESFCEQIS